MLQFEKFHDLRKEIKVTFKGELSQDAGGISREFYCVLMEEILKDALGIFAMSDVQNSYRVNEASKHIENYIAIFKFVGKILGKAFFDSVPLNINLNH